MQHFFDHNLQSLRQLCQNLDMPAYVAEQIVDWVYAKGVVDFDAMTNISKRHRAALGSSLCMYRSEILTHQLASDGTQKLLLGWIDHSAQADQPLAMLPKQRSTETVMIPTEKRRTACLSSQVGCPVGCRFCASGMGGLEGNLSAGQIVEQAHRLHWREEVGGLTNVVFMGMGEPLANYQAVTDAVRTLNAPWGLGLGARRITISTVGLPAAIRKLVKFEIPVTLALSLHAPNDEIRRQLIPWAQYASIDELLDACDEYFVKTGREITLEYLLLRGVNDRVDHAQQLAKLARRLRANINLIRYNEVRSLPYDRPTTDDVLAFQQVLRDQRVNAHVRASRGRDIAAACGQLRRQVAAAGN